MRSLTIPFFASLLLLSNCSNKAAPLALECEPSDMIEGVCVGARTETLCPGETCTSDTDCAAVKTVNDQPSLTDALKTAEPGSCVALSPGNYESADVPPGVKLLGPGFGRASVGLITFRLAKSGENAALSVVRGVSANSIQAIGNVNAEVDQCHVSKGRQVEPVQPGVSTIVAVAIAGDAALTMTDSTIESSDGYGLLGTNPTRLKLERVLVRNNLQTGIWMQCATNGDSCSCPLVPQTELASTVVRGNAGYGVTLLGVKATLSSLAIRESKGSSEGFAGGDTAEGSGLIAAGCADVSATKMTLERNASLGVLVDNSTAMVGDPNSAEGEHGIIIQGNESYGAWFQNIGSKQPGQTAALHGAMIEGNTFVGVGMAGASHGIIIQGTVIKNTKSGVLPNDVSTTEVVGDGLCWRDGAGATLDNLTFSGNARANLLLDNKAGEGSTMSGIIIQGSPGTEGSIIIQGVPDSDSSGVVGMKELTPKQLPANTIRVAPTVSDTP